MRVSILVYQETTIFRHSTNSQSRRYFIKRGRGYIYREKLPIC